MTRGDDLWPVNCCSFVVGSVHHHEKWETIEYILLNFNTNLSLSPFLQSLRLRFSFLFVPLWWNSNGPLNDALSYLCFRAHHGAQKAPVFSNSKMKKRKQNVDPVQNHPLRIFKFFFRLKDDMWLLLLAFGAVAVRRLHALFLVFILFKTLKSPNTALCYQWCATASCPSFSLKKLAAAARKGSTAESGVPIWWFSSNSRGSSRKKTKQTDREFFYSFPPSLPTFVLCLFREIPIFPLSWNSGHVVRRF